MAILVIRHGETELNAARVLQPPGAALSVRGVEQARLLARRLADRPLAAILASDLERAHATARQLHEVTGAPIELDPELRERDFGDLRGTPYSEIEVDIFSDAYRPPGGEDGATFHARVDRAWRRIAEIAGRTRGDLAVVTHGLVCRSLAEHHFALPSGLTLPTRWRNTCLTIVESRPPYRVERIACAAHLGPASLADPVESAEA
ncbi:MAG: histidine phosphatase family protein [Myxococcota bacterium]